MTESEFGRSFGVTQPVIPALNYRSPGAEEFKLTMGIYALVFLILANSAVPSALKGLGLHLTATVATFTLGALVLIGYIGVVMALTRIFLRAYSTAERDHG